MAIFSKTGKTGAGEGPFPFWRNPLNAASSLVRSWTDGELFRPGKTREEKLSGVHNRHLQNKESRRKEGR